MTTSVYAVSPVRSLLQENRLDEAVTICRQFEVLSTNDNDNFLACSWVYLRTDRVDSADKLLERLKRNFALPEYQLLLALRHLKRKQYEEAKKILGSVSVEHKGTSIGITAQEVYAEYYEAVGQLDTAAFIYKQVVGEDAKRARSHWGLGRYYLARGDARRAITHLETTIRLWPKHLGSRFNLAVLYNSQDNLTEAAKWLAECYRLDRGDPGVLEQMGLLFEKKGMLSEAVKNWQRALEIKKDSALAKEKIALYAVQVIDNLIEAKKYKEALAQIESGGLINEQPKLLLRRGLIYKATGKYDKASGDLKAYLATNPNDAQANRELGVCYVNLKLIDQAGNFFQKAVTIEPENGFNHGWLAYVYESKGEFEAAREEWRKAVELFRDPNELSKATRKLAAIEKRLGKGKSKSKKKRKGMDMGLDVRVPGDEEE